MTRMTSAGSPRRALVATYSASRASRPSPTCHSVVRRLIPKSSRQKDQRRKGTFLQFPAMSHLLVRVAGRIAGLVLLRPGVFLEKDFHLPLGLQVALDVEHAGSHERSAPSAPAPVPPLLPLAFEDDQQDEKSDSAEKERAAHDLTLSGRESQSFCRLSRRRWCSDLSSRKKPLSDRIRCFALGWYDSGATIPFRTSKDPRMSSGGHPPGGIRRPSIDDRDTP